MLRLLMILAMGGGSAACGLAAIGLVVYAGHPEVTWVAQCFAAWGFLAGLACGGLHLHFHGRPTPAPAALPPEALAGLVRATLARAAAERQGRPGTAADRRPAPVVTAPAQPAEPVAAAPVAAVAEASAP